jgi:peptide-methionine (R)-S-oxide reductase
MPPCSSNLFFGGLLGYLERVVNHRAIDDTGGGNAKVPPPAAWAERLAEAEYRILFAEGTEAPGSSPLNHETRQGTFVCAACFQPLFESNTKYTSGTGWPSFWQPIPGAIATQTDWKLALPRTEYHCAHCGGHQGHVFDDGPPPSGMRYCNNGLALRFIPAGETLPPLRK